MKAAVFYGRKDVRIEDVPEPPAPGPGQVKVKVQWCGICGTDVHEYDAGPMLIPTAPHPLTGAMAPLIIGHEFTGDVVEVGAGVTGVKVGDRVTADAAQYCGQCLYCKQGQYNLCDLLAFTGVSAPGAFAEYVNVPAFTIYKLPPGVSYEAGALVEPLAVGVHASKRGQIAAGDSVAIFGAGPIGLSTFQAVKASGATRIFCIEIARERKEFARKLGASAVLDPREMDVVKAVMDQTGGRGVDVSYECVGGGGGRTVPLAEQLTRKGGKIVIVGVFEKPQEVDMLGLLFTEKTILGSLAYTFDFSSTISLIAEGRIVTEPMITSKITLDEFVEKGLEELVTHRDRHVKIIVSPSSR